LGLLAIEIVQLLGALTIRSEHIENMISPVDGNVGVKRLNLPEAHYA
jgi:hypothetical protein